MKRKLSTIAVSLIVVLLVSASHAGADSVGISQYSSLTDAVSQIGSANKTLYIDFATSITGNTVVPANISIVMEYPGLISLGTNSLTINGPFSAGLYQVFTGSGPVAFGNGSVEYILPNWYGSLNTAICKIGSNPATVRVIDTQTLTANLAVPYTCALEITKTGSIAKVSTY